MLALNTNSLFIFWKKSSRITVMLYFTSCLVKHHVHRNLFWFSVERIQLSHKYKVSEHYQQTNIIILSSTSLENILLLGHKKAKKNRLHLNSVLNQDECRRAANFFKDPSLLFHTMHNSSDSPKVQLGWELVR